jgi:hypothetical protein
MKDIITIEVFDDKGFVMKVSATTKDMENIKAMLEFKGFSTREIGYEVLNEEISINQG